MILRNTAVNLAGFVVPLAISLIVIPSLILGFGTERFGVISILWAIIGYFGVLDLGLGRAVTYSVAQMRDTSRHGQIAHVTAQAASLLLIVGLLAALAWLMCSPSLAHLMTASSADGHFRSETAAAFAITSIALPFVVVAASLRGLLEGFQAFGAITMLRIVSGTLLFLAPAVCMWMGGGLVSAAIALVAVRVLTVLITLPFCARLPIQFRLFALPRWGVLKPLVTTGSWMTVSNFIGPLMGYADRFILGAVVGASAVAYYATPNEVVTKLWLLTGALTAVLFPAFSRLRLQSRSDLDILCRRAQKLVFGAVSPIVLLIALFSNEIMTVWISDDFARGAAPTLQVLAASMLISSVAQVPFTLLQAYGRADLTARLSLILLGPYLAGLYYAAGAFGPIGVAWVWFARMTLDYFGLAVLARSLQADLRPSTNALTGSAALISVATVLALMPDLGGISGKALAFSSVMGVLVITSWRFLLDHDDRALLQRTLNGLRWSLRR